MYVYFYKPFPSKSMQQFEFKTRMTTSVKVNRNENSFYRVVTILKKNNFQNSDRCNIMYKFKNEINDILLCENSILPDKIDIFIQTLDIIIIPYLFCKLQNMFKIDRMILN